MSKAKEMEEWERSSCKSHFYSRISRRGSRVSDIEREIKNLDNMEERNTLAMYVYEIMSTKREFFILWVS